MTQREQQITTTMNKPVQEVQAPQGGKKPPLLQMWFHDADLDLLQPINPFFLQMQHRLGGQVRTFLFSYTPEPKAPTCFDESSEYFRQQYQRDQEEYEQKKQEHERQHRAALAKALTDLEQTALLVPCVSPAFLEALDRDLAASPELAQALKNPRFHIMPIVVQPVETGPTFTMRPLCSYAEGRERAIALKELVAVMEKTLCDTLHIEPYTTSLDYLFCSPQTIQPVIASEKTTMDLVLDALEPVKHLVEQVNTQIVEARQLALAERSEHHMVETLERQVEALRQQVQARPSGFWPRLFNKKKS